MTKLLQRLGRLVRAQSEIGKALEARLAQHERRITSLLDRRIEMSRMAENAATANPALLHVFLRHLSAIDLHLTKLGREAEELRGEILSARGREKIISARLKSMREIGERKFADEQTLETASAMSAKGSGKRRVVS